MKNYRDTQIQPAERGEGGATQAPPPDRRAVGSSRTVTRGESFTTTPHPTAHSNSAITDWLNCTFKLSMHPEVLSVFFNDLRHAISKQSSPALERGRGLHGWKRSFSIEGTEALFGIGGQNGTALLSIPGTTCALFSNENWLNLVSLLHQSLDAKITRWDGAVDDYEGKHSVNWAVEQYKAGHFTTGGNRPSCSQMGNWLEEDGRGRTFYVGRRKNGKLLRVYEKGIQLGSPDSPWVRWELELHSRDREIPWNVITEPGKYVAGAFDATGWITEEACRIKTFQNTAEIAYDSLVRHASNAYGPLLNVMNAVEGSADQVLNKLIREGKPKRLHIPIPSEVCPKQPSKE